MDVATTAAVVARFTQASGAGPEGRAGHDGRSGGEGVAAEGDSAGLGEGGFHEGCDRRVYEQRGITGEAGGFDGAPGDLRGELAEHGQDGCSQQGAGAAGVEVGRILAPAEAGGPADLFGGGAVDHEHRADEFDARGQGAARPQARERSRAAATDESKEDGFQRIVGVVCGGDEAAAVDGGQRGERGVAGAAGLRFGVSGADADLGHRAGHAKISGEGLGRPGVLPGDVGGAKVVHHVGEHDVAVGEQQGEGGGVRPAGAGDEGAAINVGDGLSPGQGSPGVDDTPPLGEFQNCLANLGLRAGHEPILSGAMLDAPAQPVSPSALSVEAAPLFGSHPAATSIGAGSIAAAAVILGLMLVAYAARLRLRTGTAAPSTRAASDPEGLADVVDRLTVELDARAAKLEVLIAEADRRIAQLSRPARAVTVEPKATAFHEDPSFAEIYRLADEGQSAVEIARRTQRPTGQIELILNLRRGSVAI